jgi:hypothetical protein
VAIKKPPAFAEVERLKFSNGGAAITENHPKAQEQKPPTPNAIAKALLILTARFRVTLEPLPGPPANDDAAREHKEIIL